MHVDKAFSFLISIIFDLYSFIVLARFLLQLSRADFYNPVSQAVVKVTNPLLKPLRRLIPGWGGFDVAALLLLFLLQLIKNILILALYFFGEFSVLGLAMLTVKDCASLFIRFFFYAIVIQVIASWIAPGNHNSMLNLLNQVTEPLMGPIRRLMPSAGGLDFSPMVALLLLGFLQVLLGL